MEQNGGNRTWELYPFIPFDCCCCSCCCCCWLVFNPFIWWEFNCCWCPCPWWWLLIWCCCCCCWWWWWCPWWWWCSVKSENGAPACGSRTESINDNRLLPLELLEEWLLKPLLWFGLFWPPCPLVNRFREGSCWSQLEGPRTCSCNDTSRD